MVSIKRIVFLRNTVPKLSSSSSSSSFSLSAPSVLSLRPSSSSSSSLSLSSLHSSASARRYQSSTPVSSSSVNGNVSSSPSNDNNTTTTVIPPSVIDTGATIRVRRGSQRLTSLDANPYAWPETERIAKQAPLWMLYEAEREETILSKQDQAKEQLKLQDQSRVVLPLPSVDPKGRIYAAGGRKTSTARVAIKRGDGKFTVNGRPLASYFPRLTLRQAVIQPFVVTQSCGAFDIDAIVEGGGSSGQAGAVRHAVARALGEYDPQLKPILRYFKLLQRDPRMVERKKPGQKKARKKFQWVKR